jgi:transitional endoplasmic reticulum ATPase
VSDVNPTITSLFEEVIPLSTPSLSQKEHLLSFMIQEKISSVNADVPDFSRLKRFLNNLIPSLSSKSSYSSLSYLELCCRYDNDLDQFIQQMLTSGNDSDSQSLFASEYQQIDQYFIGHSDLKQQILNTLIFPRKYSHLYSMFQLPSTHGLLLYGPPGTGKTYLISLIAQHLNYSFINVKLSSVICGEIGSSEQKIRNIFSDAKRSIPCIVFIDEFQALFPSNDSSSSSSSSNNSLLVTLAGCIDDIQLFNQYSSTKSHNMDGNGNQSGKNSSNIIIIAATNEPWRVNKSFLRSGRFDQILYVGIMNHFDRFQLISKLFKNLLEKNSYLKWNGNSSNEEERINLEEICQEMKTYTAADLCYFFQRIEALLIEELIEKSQNNPNQHIKQEQGVDAGGIAVEDEAVECFVEITRSHFQKILKSSIPSCTAEEIEEYLQWQREMKYTLV